MIQEYPTKLFFRKKGLPATFKNVEGLLHQFDLKLFDEDEAKIKTLVFSDKLSMQKFIRRVLPQYRGGPATKKTEKVSNTAVAGVTGLTGVWTIKQKEKTKFKHEADRRYFALAVFVKGHISQNSLTHESVHVGYAWDYRTFGKPVNFPDAEENPQERICYPAGVYAAKASVELAPFAKQP